jgi:hypothetical protein
MKKTIKKRLNLYTKNKKGVVVSDSPVPVKKRDTACKSNITILKKKITKMLVLT